VPRQRIPLRVANSPSLDPIMPSAPTIRIVSRAGTCEQGEGIFLSRALCITAREVR
jgi:hypothetical protein